MVAQHSTTKNRFLLTRYFFYINHQTLQDQYISVLKSLKINLCIHTVLIISPGSARTEGYYKISLEEKMEYLTNAKSLTVQQKKTLAAEANPVSQLYSQTPVQHEFWCIWKVMLYRV